MCGASNPLKPQIPIQRAEDVSNENDDRIFPTLEPFPNFRQSLSFDAQVALL